MALDCSFQKWTAPYLANLSSEDSSVLVGIFSSISAEFARYSKLVEERCAESVVVAATLNSHAVAINSLTTRVNALTTLVNSIQVSLTATQALVATCCAGTTTTTPAPTTTTTAAPATTTPAPGTTTTPAPTTTTTPAPATTTTTAATTTTTAAPGVSCTSCTQTAVSQTSTYNPDDVLNPYTPWCRTGTAYDGTCQPVGCVGCSCPTITIWGAWSQC